MILLLVALKQVVDVDEALAWRWTQHRGLVAVIKLLHFEAIAVDALRRWHAVGVGRRWRKHEGKFLLNRDVLNRGTGRGWAMAGRSWWNGRYQRGALEVVVAPLVSILLLQVRHWVRAEARINLNRQRRVGGRNIYIVIERVIGAEQWQIKVINAIRCRCWRRVVQQRIQIVDGLLLVQAGVVRLFWETQK